MSLEAGTVTDIAAARARDALGVAARLPGERGMAAVAKQALFAEAVLAAIRAHVNALKTVAK